jgi:hypothetical protein
VHSGTIEVVQDNALGKGDLVADLESQGVLESVAAVDLVLDNPLTIQAGTLISTPPSVTAVPNGPFALSAQVISARQIDLQWHNNSGDADGYLLERQTGDGDFEPLANLSPDSLSDTDDTVTAGNTYNYRIFALNDFGDSSIATSAEVSV